MRKLLGLGLASLLVAWVWLTPGDQSLVGALLGFPAGLLIGRHD